ncbi:MAG: hypothetical protein Q4F95_15450 [Oscillospiraceae bacterium]|nr:hypothetical protein [Oscillospiraceae bacterium]
MGLRDNRKRPECPADYNVYKLSAAQTAKGSVAGAVASLLVFRIYFGSFAAGAVFGLLCSFLSVRIYRNYLVKKRNRELLIQFRDYLESAAASLSAGLNISGSLMAACDDMKMQYGSGSYIYSEALMIVSGMKNGHTAEEMITDFANRSHLRDIESFAQTFSICNRLGGNMKNIIGKTRKILTEKMSAQAEIETLASQGKNELIIMTVLPFIIVPSLKTLGSSGISENTLPNIIVKAVCLAVIAAAFIIGEKITHIKV